MEKVRYMISDAAAAVDVETHVLRYWEDELGPYAHLPCGFDMYDCIPAVHRDMPDYTLTYPVSPSDL